MHANRSITGARRAGDHGDPGLARELAEGLGHVCRSAFLTAADHLDLVRRVVQSINQGEIALTRHAERCIDVMNFQLVSKNLTSGTHVIFPFAMLALVQGETFITLGSRMRRTSSIDSSKKADYPGWHDGYRPQN